MQITLWTLLLFSAVALAILLLKARKKGLLLALAGSVLGAAIGSSTVHLWKHHHQQAPTVVAAEESSVNHPETPATETTAETSPTEDTPTAEPASDKPSDQLLAQEDTEEEQAPSEPAAKKRAFEPNVISRLISPLLRDEPEASQGFGPREYEQFNFSIELAEAGWIEMDPAKFSSDACLMLRRKKPQSTIQVVAEVIGFELEQKALTEVIRTNLAEFELLEWVELEPLEIAGIETTCVGYRLRVGNYEYHHLNAHHVHRGYARQFLLSTHQEAEWAALREEATEYFAGVSLLDPERSSIVPSRTVQPAEFSEWGCRMKAGGQGWGAPDEDGESNFALWQAVTMPSGYLFISPASLADLEVDDEALYRALLAASMGRATPTGVKPKSIDGPEHLSIFDYDFEEELTGLGKFRRLARVIRTNDAAFLIEIGAPVTNTTGFAALQEAMNQFEVDAERPASLPDLPEEYRITLLNQAGLSYYVRERYSEARPFFERASEADPDDVAYLTNILDCFLEEEKSAAVVSRFDQLPESLKKEPEVLDRLCHAYTNLGKVDLALEGYRDLFRDSYRDDATLLNAINFLIDNGRPDEAVSLLEDYRDQGTSQKLDRWQASTLNRVERYAEAVEILHGLRKSAPDNRDILIDLCDNLACLDRHDEAISLLEEALADQPNDAGLLYNLGYQLADCERFKEAAPKLEKAVAAAPRDETIREELAYVRSRLGRGHDREVLTPLDPVPLPSTIEVPQSWSPESLPIPTGRHTIYSCHAYAFVEGEPMSETIHREIAAMDTRAVEALSTLRFSFKPLYQRIFANQVEVLDPEGKVVAKAAAEDQYITEANNEKATGEKLLCIPVPGLKPGYRLRYSITLRSRSVRDAFPFTSTFFFSRHSSSVSAVSVRGNHEHYTATTRGAVRTESDGETRVWLAENQSGFPEEPRTALWERFAPTLYLGSKDLSWIKEGDDYLTQIAAQLAADPDVESLAQELVGEAVDRREKIRLLYRWIQNEFTYKAIGFGKRSRIPNPAATTCTNRYGDCKDLSVLLVSMLRAVDIEAQPFLVNTEDLVAPEIETLDQFNHMIVRIPGEIETDPILWLDPTSRYHSLIDEVAPWMEGRRGVALMKGASLLESIPAASFPPPHRIISKRTIDPAPNGGVTITENLELHGQAADSMRSYLKSLGETERIKKLRSVVQNNNEELALKTLSYQNLADQDQPMRLELTLEADYQRSASGELVKLPLNWEPDYLKVAPLESRSSPFHITFRWAFDSVTTSSIPISRPPKSRSFTDERWGNWSIQSKVADDGGEWSVAYSAAMRRADFHPADSYQEFASFWQSSLDALRRPWEEE